MHWQNVKSKKKNQQKLKSPYHNTDKQHLSSKHQNKTNLYKINFFKTNFQYQNSNSGYHKDLASQFLVSNSEQQRKIYNKKKYEHQLEATENTRYRDEDLLVCDWI